MRIFFLLSLIIASVTTSLSAENANFKARAPQAVVAGDKFQLVYTLNTEGSDIRLPALDNFQILMGPSTSYSSSTSIINGKVTREKNYSFTYILKAINEGNYTIPPATITVDGKKISSNAVPIEVVKGNSQQTTQSNKKEGPAPASAVSGEDLFITVTPSKSSLYFNESLVLTTKIYTKVQLDGLSDIKQPNLSSFIAQELPHGEGINWTIQNINGRTYNVGTYEQKLLFPQKTGKITVDPTEVEFLVRQRTARRSRSIFDDFFESNYRSVKKRVKSKPLTINVKPLPSGRPEGFSGGVGRLNMTATVNKTEAQVNDGITLKINISGTGNHKFIEDPKIKFPADFDDFDPKISNDISNTIAGMKGSKTYEYLLIPRYAGTFTIPSIKFSYFDPKTGTYKTDHSDDITITVAKGEGVDGGEGTVVRSTVTKENVKFIGKDIRFIKTSQVNLKPIGTFIFGSLSFYLLMLAPLFIFILLFFIYQKRIRENANIQLTKTKRANKVAKKRLKQSSHLLKGGEKEAFYEEMLRALWGYLSDKLSIPLAELSKDNISEILANSNVDEEAITEIIDILDTCEFARYAPASGTSEMDKLYHKTISTISKLENQIKRK